MANQESTDGQGPGSDMVRDLKASKQRLALHLGNREPLEGKIVRFDRFNLMFEDEDGDLYWIPKHAVVYAKLI